MTNRACKGNRGRGSHPRTVRGLLNVIDQFLSDGTIGSEKKQEVWDVLTGLRGPDDPRLGSRKTATTAVIRSKAFPLTRDGTFISKLMMFSHHDGPANVIDRKRTSGNNHFWTHARHAFRGLRLSWDRPNDPSETEET